MKHDPKIFIPKIKELAGQGLTTMAIANALKETFENAPTRMTIASWVKKFNIPVKTKEDHDKQRYNEVLELLKNGVRTNEIRERGYSHELIAKVSREQKLERPGRAEVAEERALSKEEVLERLPKDQKYEYLGREYGKYKIMAEDGTVFYKSATRLYQGQPKQVRSANAFAKKLFNQTGKTLVDESFTGVKNQASAICPSGKHIITYAMAEGALQNYNCPHCNNTGISKAEQELSAWIESLGLVTERYKIPKEEISPGKHKEIDIYIPSMKIGIEYCGLYYHSEKPRADKVGDLEYLSYLNEIKNKHSAKRLLCQKNEIRLITVFEDEWISRQDQVKGYLKSVFGVNSEKVDARKCTVELLDTKAANRFIDEYHIQGSASTTVEVAFGLKINGKIIGAITGNRHHRSSGSGTLVLGRLCFLSGVSVRGGSSRLLSALMKWGQDNGYSKIVSWSDNRWSEGRVYEALGFELEDESGPDYSYVRAGVKDRRFAKQSLKKTSEERNGSQTERELRMSQGYFRIWDCGKKRWAMHIK